MKNAVKTIGILCLSTFIVTSCGNKSGKTDEKKSDTIPVIAEIVRADDEGNFAIDYVLGEEIITEHKTLLGEWESFKDLTVEKKNELLGKIKTHQEKLNADFDIQKAKLDEEWKKFDTYSIEKKKEILEKADNFSDDAKGDLATAHKEILDKWNNFENLTETEKEELIAKRKDFVQKSQAKFESEKTKLNADWKNFEKLTAAKQKELVDKTEALYKKYFDKK